MLSIDSTVVLLAAGLVAGMIGTSGGITSLVSYPALLAVGVPALPANVANLVALVACWPGAALASRPELAGARRWLARGLPVAAVGAAAGSGLLLSTPPGVFARVVPWLVLAGSAALILQPALLENRSDQPQHGVLVLVLVALVAVYGGYFGAGSGVMTLALLLALLDPRLPHANAMKNMLIGAGAVASAVLFLIAGPVDWAAVLPLAVGMFLGSTVGPLLARHLPANVIRWAVALLGVGLAIELWIHPN